MSKMKLKTKLFLTYLAAGVIPVLLVSAWSYLNDSQSISDNIVASIQSYQRVVNAELALRRSYVNAVGLEASFSPAMIEAVAGEDSPSAKRALKTLMERAPLLTFATISTPDGTVIGRGHSDKTGDSVSGQESFKIAAKGNPVVDIESGTTVKMTVRGAFPIFKDGGLVGVLSLGFSLASNDFVDHIKSVIGVECTIFDQDTRSATTIVNQGQRAVGTKMANPKVIETVLKQGQNFQDKNEILGKPYDTFYWPVRDINKQVIGMFFIGIPGETVAAQQRAAMLVNLGAVIVTVIFMLLVGWLMSRSISAPINQAVDQLAESIGKVNEASRLINDACLRLADSSASQTSSLTETSAALEELTAQAKNNAQNSVQASEVMSGTNRTAHLAAESMKGMLETMASIRTSSDQVAGIIKTIEDISFQTNLLALNASVEAARAGEHGLGFAVVAEEVRNLAQRAAEAASNTNNLITESVGHSHRGEKVAREVSDSIEGTLSSTSEVNTLVKGVGEASNEQSIGIDQINQAMTVMDSAVQEISATSQETSRIANSLLIQSESLSDIMVELARLVDNTKAEELENHSSGNGSAPRGRQNLIGH